MGSNPTLTAKKNFPPEGGIFRWQGEGGIRKPQPTERSEVRFRPKEPTARRGRGYLDFWRSLENQRTSKDLVTRDRIPHLRVDAWGFERRSVARRRAEPRAGVASSERDGARKLVTESSAMSQPKNRPPGRDDLTSILRPQ